MAHKREKKALYEVIGKGQFKSLYNKPLEQKKKQILPEKPADEEEENRRQILTRWPTKPRMLELINGRIELSIPYTVMVAVGLFLILSLLIFFRLGQFYGQRNPNRVLASPTGSKSAEGKNNPAPEGAGVVYKQADKDIRSALGGAAKSGDAKTTGRNRIVIKQHSNQRDLEPAMKYFNEKGIETQILQRKEGVFLVTKKDTYNNPGKAGSDGYIAIQRIKEIGAGYKAPKGFEQFTFSDPYGEMVE
jgi:hypothetical protein